MSSFPCGWLSSDPDKVPVVMEVTFVRSPDRFILRVGKVVLICSKPHGWGSFILRDWRQRPACNLASPHSSALARGKRRRKRAKSQGNRSEVWPGKPLFLQKVRFSEMVLKVYLPSLRTRCNLMRGRRNNKEAADKDSPIPLSLKDPRERLSSGGDSWARSSRTAKNTSALKENASS